MIRKIINALWGLLAVALIAIVVVFVSISKGWIGYMPPVEELENPNYKFATEVFSEDGKVLGTFSMEKNNRVYSSYADLSPNIIHALIATEDVRFAEHSGIDAKALSVPSSSVDYCCRKVRVEVVRSHNSWQNSCLRKRWQAILCSVCCRNRSNG